MHAKLVPTSRQAKLILLTAVFAGSLLLSAQAQEQQGAAPESESPAGGQEVSISVLQASLSKTELRVLDLSEVLQMALEQNPDIKRAAKLTRQTRAKYLTSLAEFLPDFGLSYSFSHYDGAIQKIVAPGFREINFKSATPQLYFRFNLLQGGAQFFKAQAAHKALQAQRFNQQSQIQETLKETALRYYDLKQSLADLAVARVQVQETEANLAMNQERLKSGKGNELDVLQSEAQLAEAQTELNEKTANSQTAALRLNEVLSLPAFVDAMPVDQQPNMQTLVPLNADFPQYLSMAQKNPHLLDLGQQIQSIENLFKGAAVASVIPEGFIQTRRGSVGNQADGRLGFDEDAGSVGFTFRNMGFSSTFKARDLKAQLAALRDQLASEQNRLRREVSEAYTIARARQSQLLSAQQQLAKSQQAREAAIALLKEDKGRNIDLLQAQAGLNAARHQLNSTVFDYNRSQVELVSTMGLASVGTLTNGISTAISANSH